MHNIVIAACALRGDLDRAFATHSEMEKRDVQTYNNLMLAVEMAGGEGEKKGLFGGLFK